MPADFQNTTTKRLAAFLITIGLLFAIDSFFKLHFVHKLWPLVITILSVGIIGIFFSRNAKGGIYLATGVYLLCFSVLALYCSFYGWSRLSYFWPLFITFLGIVFIAMYIFSKKTRFNLLAGLLLVSLSIIFFVVFNISGHYWWIVFILAGLSIFISELMR